MGILAGIAILANKLEERKQKKVRRLDFSKLEKIFPPTEFEKDKRMPDYFKHYITMERVRSRVRLAKEDENELFYGMARRYFNKETGIFDEEKFLKEHPDAKNPIQPIV